jgi:hypothetical protein
LVDTRDDFLGDSCGIDMFGIKSITQSRDTGCDLVELDTLLASICGFISPKLRVDFAEHTTLEHEHDSDVWLYRRGWAERGSGGFPAADNQVQDAMKCDLKKKSVKSRRRIEVVEGGWRM